jgi:hypothetical protein
MNENPNKITINKDAGINNTKDTNVASLSCKTHGDKNTIIILRISNLYSDAIIVGNEAIMKRIKALLILDIINSVSDSSLRSYTIII